MPRVPMTREETALAKTLYAAVEYAATTSERAQQAGRFVLGVSDIGTCPERTRRLLAHIPEPEPADKLPSFIGSAYGDWFERAVLLSHPDALIQARVAGTLRSGQNEWTIIGHPDILWTLDGYGLVIDGKTVDGLELIRRTGPDEQQLFQRHIYALCAHESGVPGFEDLNRIKTANVWADRSGSTPEFYVHMDDYQPEIVQAAGLWLESVMYAFEHDEVAEKVPPRTWCEKACGHFPDCRLFDVNVAGLIKDPALAEAALMNEQGKALRDVGARLVAESKAALVGVEGYTHTHQVRWINVNGSADGSRAGHQRLEVRRISGVLGDVSAANGNGAEQ